MRRLRWVLPRFTIPLFRGSGLVSVPRLRRGSQALVLGGPPNRVVDDRGCQRFFAGSPASAAAQCSSVSVLGISALGFWAALGASWLHLLAVGW